MRKECYAFDVSGFLVGEMRFI